VEKRAQARAACRSVSWLPAGLRAAEKLPPSQVAGQSDWSRRFLQILCGAGSKVTLWQGHDAILFGQCTAPRGQRAVARDAEPRDLCKHECQSVRPQHGRHQPANPSNECPAAAGKPLSKLRGQAGRAAPHWWHIVQASRGEPVHARC